MYTLIYIYTLNYICIIPIFIHPDSMVAFLDSPTIYLDIEATMATAGFHDSVKLRQQAS